MERRLFVKTSLLCAAAGSIVPTRSNASLQKNAKNKKQVLYELRVYTFKTPEQETITENYFEKAAIPALNRSGSTTIGVFKELTPAAQIKLYVLIPYQSMDHFMQADEKLMQDAVYTAAGAAYLEATAAAPAYERIESSLLKAFEHFPEIVPPAKKPSLFELRRYESATEMAGKKKIEMFNEKGEIDIFKRTGLAPVFFGETIIGTLRPNLTYMLSFDDMAGHDAHWKMVGTDPEWKKISAVPEYADAKIVSRITSVFLVPAPYSQV